MTSSWLFFSIGGLLLSLSHLLAALYLPVADCDETYNFVEPIHFILYGTGKQTWENCNSFSLRSWLFAYLYALPSIVRYRFFPLALHRIGFPFSVSTFIPPRSIDVYFFQRVVYGQAACVAELFFVDSIRSTYRGRAHLPLVALGLLWTSSAIPHAAVSVLPTSFAMILFFVALGAWLRCGCVRLGSSAQERRSSSHKREQGVTWSALSSSNEAAAPKEPIVYSHSPFFAILAIGLVVLTFFVAWPFACLIAVPMVIDLLCRYTTIVAVCGFAFSMVVAGIVMYSDSFFYCRRTFSSWNIILYNVFSGGSAALYGVEPWFFFYKNLLVNFHFVFLFGLIAPLVVLAQPRLPLSYLYSASETRASAERGKPSRRSRRAVRITPSNSIFSELMYTASFSLWFFFWNCIPHKEERFMAPAYPFLILSATLSLSRLTLHSAAEESTRALENPVSLATAGNIKEPGIGIGMRRRTSSKCASEQAINEGKKPSSNRKRRSKGKFFFSAFVVVFFFITAALSISRAVALYTFYSAPQRLLYDSYSVLSEATQAKRAVTRVGNSSADEGPSSYRDWATPSGYWEDFPVFRICVGKEWYRFPSSFFLDFYTPPTLQLTASQPVSHFAFLRTKSFSGALPLDFILHSPAASGILNFSLDSSLWPAASVIPRACLCGSPLVNDQNVAIKQQYINGNPSDVCDVIMDSLPLPGLKLMSERSIDHTLSYAEQEILGESMELELSVFTEPIIPPAASVYRLLDAGRTPMWCRVLYYPFGITESCAAWREMVLQRKSALNNTDR